MFRTKEIKLVDNTLNSKRPDELHVKQRKAFKIIPEAKE